MNRDTGSIMTAVLCSLVCLCLWASAGYAEISEGYDENTELTAMGRNGKGSGLCLCV